MEKRRVVITGMGAITPIGNSPEHSRRVLGKHQSWKKWYRTNYTV